MKSAFLSFCGVCVLIYVAISAHRIHLGHAEASGSNWALVTMYAALGLGLVFNRQLAGPTRAAMIWFGRSGPLGEIGSLMSIRRRHPTRRDQVNQLILDIVNEACDDSKGGGQ